MYGASDLRKGLKVEVDGVPYVITEFNFVKPGKGQALYTCRLKNMINGSTFMKTYRAADSIDQPAIDEKTLQFSYADGQDYVFLDQSFEQVTIPAEALGNLRLLMVENATVEVLFHNNNPIEIKLQNFVEKEVVHTEPGMRGDTATNVMKPATVKGGYELQVPLFVNQGDIIRIDTRTGDYADRVRK